LTPAAAQQSISTMATPIGPSIGPAGP